MIILKSYTDPQRQLSQWIRECSPKKEDWEEYYFNKLADFLKSNGISLSPEEYIEHLGEKLYIKITEVIQSEIEQVREQDCIEYVYNLVINRTYEGYQTEIKTIYGKLQKDLGVEIKPAPDKWDRLYNVDFYIQVGGKYIGLQIKPITYEQTPETHKWKEWLNKAHKKFEENFGGKVFIIFSIKEGQNKRIFNEEIIEEIRKEIEKLKLS